MRVCGGDHGLLERLSIVTDVQVDVALLCLLCKYVATQEQEVIMAAKIRVKFKQALTIKGYSLCL